GVRPFSLPKPPATLLSPLSLHDALPIWSPVPSPPTRLGSRSSGFSGPVLIGVRPCDPAIGVRVFCTLGALTVSLTPHGSADLGLTQNRASAAAAEMTRRTMIFSPKSLRASVRPAPRRGKEAPCGVRSPRRAPAGRRAGAPAPPRGPTSPRPARALCRDLAGAPTPAERFSTIW